MTQAQPNPATCRKVDYSSSGPIKCTANAVLAGYCVAHVPDQLTRQHFTRTLTTKVIQAAKVVIDEAAEHGVPSNGALDALALAYVSLSEWRKL